MSAPKTICIVFMKIIPEINPCEFTGKEIILKNY